MQIGDMVVTPNGVGMLYSIEGDEATVEMDYMYLVGYPVSKVKPYPLQKEVSDGKDKG